MKSVAISLALGLAAGAATISFAQERPPSRQGPFPERGPRSVFTDDDRAAFADGRIAGLKGSLRLTAEQEKLWPPVEQALRDLARQRREAWAARRERWASLRADREAGRMPAQRDIPQAMRERADRMSKTAESLRKLSDASAPLYASLDDGQKRRLGAMLRLMGPGGTGMRAHRHGWHRHGWREERGMDRSGPRERRGALEERGREFGERHGEPGPRRRWREERYGEYGYDRERRPSRRDYVERDDERGYDAWRERRGWDRDADRDRFEGRRWQ